MSEEPRKSWRVDHTIPVALILTIILQSAAAVWWASSVSSRLNQLEQTVDERNLDSERIARLEERLKSLEVNLIYRLDRIEKKLN